MEGMHWCDYSIELHKNSRLFREVFDAMSLCNEDSVHHHDEDTATHTRCVMFLMEKGLEGFPEEVVSMGRLMAALHDIGKPSTRSEDERGVHFYKHEAASAKLAGPILKELGVPDPEAEFIVLVVAQHGRLLQLLRDEKCADAIIKDESLWCVVNGHPVMHFLTTLAAADMGSVENHEGVVRLAYLSSMLWHKRHHYLKELAEVAAAKAKKAAMSAPEFAAQFRGDAIALRKALSQRYKLADAEIDALIAARK